MDGGQVTPVCVKDSGAVSIRRVSVPWDEVGGFLPGPGLTVFS